MPRCKQHAVGAQEVFPENQFGIVRRVYFTYLGGPVSAFDTPADHSGGWTYGKRFGHGVEHYRDGRVYDGEFAYGLWNGHGILTYPNGDRYDGNFRGGRMISPDAMTHTQSAPGGQPN